MNALVSVGELQDRCHAVNNFQREYKNVPSVLLWTYAREGVHISIAKPPPRVLKTRFRKRPRSYIAAILRHGEACLSLWDPYVLLLLRM